MDKNDLYKLSAVDVYNKVREGKELKKFPIGFWQKPEGEKNATEIIKYLLQDILGWNEEDIKKNLSQDTFRNNYLKGMMTTLFNDSIYKAINHTYPDKIKPWELNQVSPSYWSKETGLESLRWMIEDKLKWSDEDIKKNLSVKTFIDCKLKSMLYVIYDGSPFKAINMLYPKKFHPWELLVVPNGYWKNKESKKNAKKAVKWLIEKKLKWTNDDIKKKLTTQTFKDNDLNGMLKIVFSGSIYDAINHAYPGKYKPWELKSVPNNFWNKETAILAIQWLIEDKLSWTLEDIKSKMSYKIFLDNGFSNVIDKIFKGSPYRAISETYPDMFRKDEFRTKDNLKKKNIA